jgi:hypothetical protein
MLGVEVGVEVGVGVGRKRWIFGCGAREERACGCRAGHGGV